VKAFELTGAIERLFACIDGEPRAWTRNPPQPLPETDEEYYAIPDEDKNWYAVFGFSCKDCTEEQLIDALWADVQRMHALCVNERPTLIWRRKPEYREGTFNRKRFKTISIRIVIPEIAHGSLREEWLRTPAHKPECAPYNSPKVTNEQA
jgi:hypothetical protein